jgi:uncharacterized protein GlcG (DUF336 family)
MDYKKVSQAVDAAQNKAKELGVSVSVAVVDEYGDLVSFTRMEGALKISPKFAIAKAYTSGSLGMPTDGIAEYAKEGKPYHGINDLFGGELTTIAGGLPIMVDGKLVGGVGVGGSTDVNQDKEAAQAAVDVLQG